MIIIAIIKHFTIIIAIVIIIINVIIIDVITVIIAAMWKSLKQI